MSKLCATLIAVILSSHTISFSLSFLSHSLPLTFYLYLTNTKAAPEEGDGAAAADTEVVPAGSEAEPVAIKKKKRR